MFIRSTQMRSGCMMRYARLTSELYWIWYMIGNWCSGEGGGMRGILLLYLCIFCSRRGWFTVCGRTMRWRMLGPRSLRMNWWPSTLSPRSRLSWCVLCYLCLTVHILYQLDIQCTSLPLVCTLLFVPHCSRFLYHPDIQCTARWCVLHYLYLSVHILYCCAMQCASLPLVLNLLFVPHCSYSLSPWHTVYCPLVCTSLFVPLCSHSLLLCYAMCIITTGA